MDRTQAETEIGLILKQLEIDTGALVESVAVKDHDATTYEDTKRQTVAHVEIEMRHVPGRRW